MPIRTLSHALVAGLLGLASLAAHSQTLVAMPSSLAFDPQAVGASSTLRHVTILNQASAEIAVSMSIAGDFSFVSSCPALILPLASCDLYVSFNPLYVGPRLGWITILVNNDGFPSTVTVNLSGTAEPPPFPALQFTPGEIDFGAQDLNTDSPATIVQIANTGSAPLYLGLKDTTLADFALSPSKIPGGDCGYVLLPGQACDVAVVFHPTAAGTRDGQLRVFNNGAPSPATVHLAGGGIVLPPPPQLAMIGQLAFGSQAVGTASSAQAVAITNQTSNPVSITSLTATGDFSLSGSCTTVAPKATCNVSVSFQPTAVGARTGTITVKTANESQPYAIALTGTGIVNPVPVARLSATTLGFGNVIYGSSFSQGLSLSNVGTAPLQLISFTMRGNSDFTQTNTCGTSLAAGAQCRITVNFAPHALGERNGTLSIVSNAAGSPHRLDMGGTGCRYFSPAAARFFLTSC